MAPDLPDYSSIEPPDEKPLEEYTHHERRAALLRSVISRGSPFALNQSHQAERFGVHRSTVSRDMDRLRESIDENLGIDAKLTTRALFERTVLELLNEDDWRAKKAAFDCVLDWNEWLADIGEQHREPRQSELDVDMRSRHAEVAYEVVREGDDDPLPTADDESDTPDYEALGFTSGPAEIDVEPTEGETDE